MAVSHLRKPGAGVFFVVKDADGGIAATIAIGAGITIAAGTAGGGSFDFRRMNETGAR